MQLPGGAPWPGPSPGACNVLSLDGGGSMMQMPPSPGAPGAGGAFGKQSQSQIQEKMARQRQLALERRKLAGRVAAGGMAQANQLPPASVQPLKAPGWDRVLCDGIDKPGSLAEKAEAAFKADSKLKMSPMSLKAHGQLGVLDDKGFGEAEAKTPTRFPSPMMSEVKPKPTNPEEWEMTDILDFETPNIQNDFNRPQPGQFQKPGIGGGDIGAKSWNMQVEEPISVPQAAAPQEQANGGAGRRWYKPSTWNKGRKSVEEPQPTSVVQALGTVQPMSTSELTDDAPLHFSGENKSPGRRRRPQPVTEAKPAAMDIFMDCPGAIFDTPAPAAQVPTPKVKPRNKHFSEDVERAAFPQEERAAKLAEERANSTQGKLEALEKRKKQAIANEDFLEAQRLKGEIEALQKEANAQPAPAPNAVQSLSSAPPQRNIGDDEVLTFNGPQGMMQRPARQPAADSWNTQEPSSAQPAPGADGPVRKRFWKPWGGGPAAPEKKRESPSLVEEATMVSMFDSS